LSPSLEPTRDWSSKWPCLDNGQFAWALYESIHATSNYGEKELSSRLKAHFDEMCEYAVLGGYAKDGRIAMICNIEGKDFSPQGYDPMPWDQEPFSYFVDLFGNWEKAGYNLDEREKLWKDPKRARMAARVEMDTPDGPIAVLKGWHFSSHEMWKYLQLPLRNIDCTRNVLLNGERARTHFASVNHIPGLLASCTAPDSTYFDRAGIAEGISCLHASCTKLLTPYGGFPTILADEATGVAWLLSILKGKGMQGHLGSSESIWADGSAACRILTWDAKVTTVLAVLGGGDHLEAYLRADKVWDRFHAITNIIYDEKFGGQLPGSDFPFCMPAATFDAGSCT